ncbi:glycosyltransferase family 4 protein [Clostridium sp. CS001]|uniref:glycosyltransferase family 4 protein n=1 Tax=Clostridium sp. CS001 TaxID=2880648 RepID=UPI001CF318A7|nr:glycosyltransferase family 4 protein [Clostridium sp. CS001]MCB2289993.1 glycosyltransferase family 4 protein [Clostridium sp. CS001]
MQNKKNILIYAHYFYPDLASTGQILTELCEGLQADFNITVICVVPSYEGKVGENYKNHRVYKEKYQDINVVRVRVPEFDKKNKLSRERNIIAYFFNALFATLVVGKQDLVFSISQPPILGGILGVLGKFIKSARLVYNIQDFNPEQTEVIGYAKNKLLLNFVRALDKFSCRASDTVIVVGRDMQDTLNKRFKGRNMPKSVVINNWIDEKQIYPLEDNHPEVLEFKEKYKLSDKFVFMYSGNIGLYYDLENIIKVIGKFKDRCDVVFAFVGDGSVKQTLIDYVDLNGLSNVRFIPYQRKEDLIYSLNVADVHIVSNAKGIKGISVPSKVYGIMAAGKAVLGILEEHSEVRLIIESTKCGVCCEPGDYEELHKLLYSIIKNRKTIKDKGVLGRVYLEENLKKELSVLKYKQSIHGILG